MKSRAIVLHTIKYNDTTNIVNVYTEKEGRVSFLVRVPRTPRAGVKNVLFQPLALLDLEWNHRPTSGFQRVKNAMSCYPFRSLPYDGYKCSIALFLAEFLSYALREEQHGTAMFEYVFTSIQWLDTAQKSFSNFHLVFLMRLSRFLGFYPNLENYSEGNYFDMMNSCFVPVQPLHPHFVVPEDAVRLPLLIRMNYETMNLFAFSRRERERLLNFVNDYYRLHLPSFPELKSLKVLREVFEG